MGKKMKNKIRNPRKPQNRTPSLPSQSVSELGDRKGVAGKEGVKGGENCNHCTKDSIELNRILSEIRSSSNNVVRCEDCRVDPAKKRGNKEKSRQPKKKTGSRTAEGEFMWVCLDCSRCYCGGDVSDLAPYGHARWHAKKEHHSWVVRFDDPFICWCFPCNSLVPIEMLQGVNGDEKSAMDIENVGFSSNAERGKGMENRGETLVLESMKGYTVRGLVNLGNTCFFNSVMQNLLAIDGLRDYLASLDLPTGPLTVALKKLFSETNASWDAKGSLNPKALFSCICMKAPQFRGYQQQDSHELLRYLLDGLHGEETSARKSLDSCDEQDKGTTNSEPTFVDVIFGGQLSSTVSCVECGHTSVVYEPFLDLSLPVPSKKPPPKKVSLSTPKKNKPGSREMNRGRKVRGKGISKGCPLIELHKAESSAPPSECNESCVPASEPKQTVVMGAEENFTWMDYVEPTAVLDCADSVSHNYEAPIAQCSESGKICEGENYVHFASNFQADACPEEQIEPSDSCGTSSCRDDNPSTCTQDSAVLVLPPKELDPTVEVINRVTQKPEDMASVGSTVKESSAQTTSVAGCEQAELDFDGFGDLFNEPEITSGLNTETGMHEEMDTTLWTVNNSESNQDEVDNTNALVSVDSCLALFTKSELLSDEHAWNCERCSESLLHQNLEQRKGKRQAVARLDQSEALKSQVDVDKFRSKKPSPSLGVDFVESIELKASKSGNMKTNSRDLVLHTEGLHDPNADADVSQESFSLIGRPCSIDCKEGQAGDEKSLELPKPIFSDKACCPVVFQRDGDFSELDHTSQYRLCPSAHEASILQERTGKNDSDSCSTNDLNGVGCGGQDLAAVSSSLQDCMETVLQSSCENDNFSEVNQIGKEGSQLLSKVHPENDSDGEKMETESRRVKRDATKRILINRVPSILTIHLKRFSQDDRGRLNKLRGHVSFRETLDLRPYMDPRCVEKDKYCYQLVGLVEHSGSMTGGHYVAYVRGERSRGKAEKGNSSGSSWFYASDAYVREVPFSEVLRSDAYILFYEKVCC